MRCDCIPSADVQLSGRIVIVVIFFFFFQAEDGIRDYKVTGVQTCALPILFRGKVHIGYLAAIVAASNAGGSGSVVGDTTTTMMWIDGVDPLDVLEAFVAAGIAMAIFGIPAAMQQHRYSPITKDASAGVRVDWPRVLIVAFILVTAIVVNVLINVRYSE